LALAFADRSNHMFFIGEKESVGGARRFLDHFARMREHAHIFNSMVPFRDGEFIHPKKDRDHLN
jgi:hypothetical protein